MEDEIKLSEFFLLLLIFWGPVFAIAAVIQARVIRYTGHIKSLLFIALVSEAMLALGIWLSPIHKLFLNLNILGGFSIGALPLQAGILSAIIVTLILIFMCRGNSNAMR